MGENGRYQRYTLRNDRHWVDSDCENQCFYKLEGGLKLSDGSQHSPQFSTIFQETRPLGKERTLASALIPETVTAGQTLPPDPTLPLR